MWGEGAGRRVRSREVEGPWGNFSVAPTLVRRSRPKRGTGREGRTRNEWVKDLPSRRQGRDAVASGQVGLPSIPMTEIMEGEKGPEKEGRKE